MKPNRKFKKPDSSSKLVLEQVVGLTVKNANGLASSASSSTCAYVAGCVVVLYNVESGKQSLLMASNRRPKPLSCVAMSEDGNFVAAGESGHQPAVIVWNSMNFAFLSELKSHQHGVECTAFSPDGKHLVSVGFPHDGYICLWNWRNEVLVTKLKACPSCSSVESVSFTSDARFIVTAGKKHLKFWTVGSSARPRANTGAKSLAMQGKPINLGHPKGCSIIDVTSPILTNNIIVNHGQAVENFPIYALTNAGVLCLLNSRLSARTSVDLKVKKAFALSVSNQLIACACNNGVVKLFTTESLEYCGSLQYTEAERHKKSDDMDCHGKVSKKESSVASLPHAIACQFSTSEKLVVVYGDHSLYLWDVHDVGKATSCCLLVSHGACIWDIKNLPCQNMHDPYLACIARGCSGGASFATCSADGTIRLWDLAIDPVSSLDDLTLAKNQNNLKTELVKTSCVVNAGILSQEVALGTSTPGLRSMAVSSDGKHLAAGDCQGNLHIYNLYTSDYICFQDTHDAEILSLSFSLSDKKDVFSEKKLSNHFLASGGRDQMIHLYDVESNFDVIGSVDDHSAAVTSVKLTSDGCKILSCSTDRSLMIHDVAVTNTGCKISRHNNQMSCFGTVYDMAVDPTVEVAVTVGQGKKINTFSIATGKLIRSFKKDGDFRDLLKVIVDPTCSFLVCTYSDRSICMHDFFTGDIVARGVGHGEVITGIIFLPDCKHIVSVAGDCCIFIWKVPASLSSKIWQKIKVNSRQLFPTALNHTNFHGCKSDHEDVTLPESSTPISEKLFCQGGNLQETSTFKFSISRLPKWAQARVTSPQIMPKALKGTLSQQEIGWAVFSTSVGSHANPDIQTPNKHDLTCSKPFLGSMSIYSSDIATGDRSEMSQEAHRRSFALDRRWLKIHTVCLDLLNSPGVCDMDMKVLVTSPSRCLSKDPVLEMTGESAVSDLSSRDPSVLSMDITMLNPSSSSCHNNYQFEIKACQGLAVPELCQSETSESRVQVMMDANAPYFNSQDKDMLKQNLCDISARLKTAERKSSGRKSYSGQFFLQQDLVSGQIDTPNQDSGVGIEQGKQTAYLVMSEYQTVPVPEESQGAETREQDLNLMPELLSSGNILSRNNSAACSAINNSGNLESVNIRYQHKSNIEGCEKQNMIVACKESLLSLQTASEDAFHLFSKIGTLANREEVSRGCEAQLYREAAEMLPSITKKVHEIAKLVGRHRQSQSPCGKI